MNTNLSDALEIPAIQAGILGDRRNIAHRFLTRQGGTSAPPLDTLNAGFGAGDAAENVARNRARIAGLLGIDPAALLTLAQIHSPEVITVDRPFDIATAPSADALVTSRPGIGLGILTADCAPVLMADWKAGVIGAAHAGWRGALDGVLDRTVAAMEKLGARRETTVAAIGPCIGPRSYEVGPEFPARFLARRPDSAICFRKADRTGHFLFDLPGFAAMSLRQAGIEQIETIGADTFSEESRFFSYRRSSLRGEKAYGRQMSVIALKDA